MSSSIVAKAMRKISRELATALIFPLMKVKIAMHKSKDKKIGL